ncbi:TniB family NTP-binding protein [Undibacterium sp. Rencai35W]|uniref:TniB family NTP-binding protein n=1 Tax=Undibacterium sp. Rencai35W TaxID=3413046 RepID=UPI003BEFCBC8
MKQNLPLELRIRSLHESTWIGYGRAIEIRNTLEQLLVHPAKHRMPNLAIIGETNNGKTMLLKNFLRRHAPNPDPTIDIVSLPVLMIQTPPDPDETRLYGALLERLQAYGSPREPADAKLRRLQKILQDLQTKMIMLDEFQHALAGTPIRQRKFLNGLKYLGNELEIPIVVSGTPDGLNALQTDQQIANRFEPVFLPKWRKGEEFLRLLASIEKVLGLAYPSGLASDNMAAKILDESEGTIGEVMRLIRLLAEQAIRSGIERITFDAIRDSNLKKIGWRKPSTRTRYPG